jgi:hypothetical protein
MLQIGATWKSKHDICKEYECSLEKGVVERKLINQCVTTCGIVNFRCEDKERKADIVLFPGPGVRESRFKRLLRKVRG